MNDRQLAWMERLRLCWGKPCDYRSDTGYTMPLDAYYQAMDGLATSDILRLADGVRQTSLRGWSGSWARKWTRGKDF